MPDDELVMTSLRLPRSHLDALQRMAGPNGMAQVVRRLVADYVSQERVQQAIAERQRHYGGQALRRLEELREDRP